MVKVRAKGFKERWTRQWDADENDSAHDLEQDHHAVSKFDVTYFFDTVLK